MTVVVADSSPLNYLTLIGSVDVLRLLYGRVLIPRQVADELTHAGAPIDVREWARRLPDWIEVRDGSPISDTALGHLDRGEQAAIVLAQRETALLIIDDALGRREASSRGIETIGTLGVLSAAAVKGHVDLPAALERLLDTNYRISRTLVDAVIAEDVARRRHRE